MMKREIILYGCSKQGLVEYNYLLKSLPDTQFKFCATEKNTGYILRNSCNITKRFIFYG